LYAIGVLSAANNPLSSARAAFISSTSSISNLFSYLSTD